MLDTLIEDEFNKFYRADLGEFIKKSGAVLSERELKDFVRNHERLPLLKNNLKKQVRSKGFSAYDIKDIGNLRG